MPHARQPSLQTLVKLQLSAIIGNEDILQVLLKYCNLKFMGTKQATNKLKVADFAYMFSKIMNRIEDKNLSIHIPDLRVFT